VQPKSFPPLNVPANFNTTHRFRGLVADGADVSLDLTDDIKTMANLYGLTDARLATTPDHRMVRLTGMAAAARGAILGERQLPGGVPPAGPGRPGNASGAQSKSVFDLVSEADKKRLADNLMLNFAAPTETTTVL